MKVMVKLINTWEGNQMKKIILLLLLGSTAFANDVNNSNNTIIVKPEITIKSGCCTDSCKKQKTRTIIKTVVQKVEVEKQVVVPVEVEKIVYVDRPILQEKIVVKKVRKNNRISLLGGVGPTHLVDNTPGRIDLYRSAVGGLMYQRSVSESWNLGIQGQTNQTVLGTLGYDF